MSPRTLDLSDLLQSYVLDVGVREHPAQRDLRLATDSLSDGGMRSSAEQAQLLAFLIELTGARRVLEIGCFTGYGTLAMALALPPDGSVTTLDVNADWGRYRPKILAGGWRRRTHRASTGLGAGEP